VPRAYHDRMTVPCVLRWTPIFVHMLGVDIFGGARTGRYRFKSYLELMMGVKIQIRT
jgi:hypothetical protein